MTHNASVQRRAESPSDATDGWAAASGCVGLTGDNALDDSPSQALVPLDVETFGSNVLERTSEQAVRMKANPNWLHQALSRVND